ncbi:DsrE family protein [Methylophaga thalassica]|uniref:DsrE family protein n=1 Tax=Methylophaga aminisulfidivorans TaxID=230105 RepID=UPI0024E23F99|nr:DsrE family protein [Methylophaga aminisulfidivorans]
MSEFLFMQSRDPFTDALTKSQYELIHHLATAGNRVTVVLVQNGVMPATKSSIFTPFTKLLHENITLVADKFSLQQREIDAEQLIPEILTTDLDIVIKALLSGQKVIWN